MLLALMNLSLAAPNMSLHVQLDSQTLKHGDFGLDPTETSRLQSPGLRLGVELNPRVMVQADWHHARTGGMLWANEDDDYNADTSAKLVYASDQFDLGLRLEPMDWKVLQPYAGVQASFAMGRYHMDADQNDDSELTELHRRAASFGGLAVGGAELVLGNEEWFMQPSAYLEMGYALRTPQSFESVGDLRSGGYLVRLGTGLRF
jgi:hypothetical protein